MIVSATSGGANHTQIQSAFDGLPVHRTRFEEVRLIGDFVISDSIRIPGRILLCVCDARLRLAAGVNAVMIRFTGEHVALCGGVFDASG